MWPCTERRAIDVGVGSRGFPINTERVTLFSKPDRKV